MLTLGHWIFIIFVIVIIITLAFRTQPVMAAALGLFAVGLTHEYSLIGAIQISFRALSLATRNLLSVILLIGMVIAISELMKQTGADQFLSKPLIKLKKPLHIYWIVGFVMWGLTSLLWPTPAVTLLGAVVVPMFTRSGINPMLIAASLSIFGEGLGLSGDYIIQGAPSLLSKATTIPVTNIVQISFPLVLISGFTAAVVGYSRVYRLQGSSSTNKNSHFKQTELFINNKLTKLIAFIIALAYLLTIIIIVGWKIRGEAASAITGGVTLLLIIIVTLLKDKGNAFSTFVDYLKNGLKFSMGVFAPIVVMSGFFFLGTEAGAKEILMSGGTGYFVDFAVKLSNIIPLNKWLIGLIIIFTAILGSLDGSGFSSIPLVGGIAVAVSQISGLPAVHFAVLGQVIGVWTGAVLIPWGFNAVTAAVTGVDSLRLSRFNLPAYLGAVITAYIWTMINI